MTQEETEAAAVRGVDLTPEQIQKLRATLLNLDGKTSLAKRFRAMFALRGVGSPEAIQIISDGEVLFWKQCTYEKRRDAQRSHAQLSKTTPRCWGTNWLTVLDKLALLRLLDSLSLL